MSPRYPRIRVREGSFPRVSGDEPNAPQEMRTILVFSPRERG